MPQIIVIADGPTEDGQPPVMLQERVSGSDFESQHFARQLVERIGWAVGDAEEVDRRESRRAPRRPGSSKLRERRAAARQLAPDPRGTPGPERKPDPRHTPGPEREPAFSGPRPAPPAW